jgi:methylglyoxal synthase
MVSQKKTLRFGLAANKFHRSSSESGLKSWLDEAHTDIRALGISFYAVGGAYDSIQATNHSSLIKFDRAPDGYRGGLMRLVSRIVGGISKTDVLDGVIYLINPVDPSSTYPETQALKRQCVIHGKPFISTICGAVEWMFIEACHAKIVPPERIFQYIQQLSSQTVALVAHDALKPQMLDFANKNFELLSQFNVRIGTGTTGGLLNELAWQKGFPKSEHWVNCYHSGPMGGDAQIAELLLDGQCQKIIFFEDPHVARQHEADIQLMERAVWSRSDYATCINSPAMAHCWASAISPRLGLQIRRN